MSTTYGSNAKLFLLSKDNPDDKYLTQSAEEFHCGPIAIYNLLKSMNKHISIDELQKLCKPNIAVGTSYKRMDYVLNIIKEKYNITIYEDDICTKKINKTLKSGGKVILLFYWELEGVTFGLHYSLIESMMAFTNSLRL